MDIPLNQNPLLLWFLEVFTNFADSIALLSLIFLVAVWLINKRPSKTLSHIVVPVMITTLIILLFKIIVPRGTGGSLAFLSLHLQLPFPLYSFPSGHAGRAFALAVALGARFPKWLAGFFIVAAFIGYSRIYLGAHDVLEVIVGALLGTVVSLVYASAITRKPIADRTPST